MNSSTTPFWTGLFPIAGCLIIFVLYNGCFIEVLVFKRCRPWSDAAFCGVWSGSALFVYYLFGRFQTKLDELFPSFPNTVYADLIDMCLSLSSYVGYCRCAVLLFCHCLFLLSCSIGVCGKTVLSNCDLYCAHLFIFLTSVKISLRHIQPRAVEIPCPTCPTSFSPDNK